MCTIAECALAGLAQGYSGTGSLGIGMQTCARDLVFTLLRFMHQQHGILPDAYQWQLVVSACSSCLEQLPDFLLHLTADAAETALCDPTAHCWAIALANRLNKLSLADALYAQLYTVHLVDHWSDEHGVIDLHGFAKASATCAVRLVIADARKSRNTCHPGGHYHDKDTQLHIITGERRALNMLLRMVCVHKYTALGLIVITNSLFDSIL
jgi:hypothetical protein